MKLTTEQQNAFDTIIKAIETNEPKMFFIQALAGKITLPKLKVIQT